MINDCDPALASWSSDGDCFVIRDVDAFASVRVAFLEKLEMLLARRTTHSLSPWCCVVHSF